MQKNNCNHEFDNPSSIEETITVEQQGDTLTITDTVTTKYKTGPGYDIPLLDDYSDMGG